MPLKLWYPEKDGLSPNLVNDSIPVLFGEGGLSKSGNVVELQLTFLEVRFSCCHGTRSWSDRKEIITSASRCVLCCAPGSFLDRPLVNEYVEILWSTLLQVWPDLRRKHREPTNFVTCDVDVPYDRSRYSFER